MIIAFIFISTIIIFVKNETRVSCESRITNILAESLIYFQRTRTGHTKKEGIYHEQHSH